MTQSAWRNRNHFSFKLYFTLYFPPSFVTDRSTTRLKPDRISLLKNLEMFHESILSSSRGASPPVDRREWFSMERERQTVQTRLDWVLNLLFAIIMLIWMKPLTRTRTHTHTQYATKKGESYAFRKDSQRRLICRWWWGRWWWCH